MPIGLDFQTFGNSTKCTHPGGKESTWKVVIMNIIQWHSGPSIRSRIDSFFLYFLVLKSPKSLRPLGQRNGHRTTFVSRILSKIFTQCSFNTECMPKILVEMQSWLNMLQIDYRFWTASIDQKLQNFAEFS